MKRRRVLVLGAGGFIGRNVAERMAARGDSVVAAVHRESPFAAGTIRMVRGRFDLPDAFTALLREVDVVVHAASASTPGSSSGQPLQELEANLRPTLALLTAMQEFPERELVYLSSGGTLYGDTQHANEQAPIRPRSYHGAAKASAEHFIHAWAQQYGGSAVILRPSNVYGPGQPGRPGFGIIPAAFECARTGKPLLVWGDGTAIRDYLYVDDLTSLVERVLDSPMPAGCSAFNAARGRGTPLNALLSALEQVVGRPVRREYHPARKADVHLIVPDPTRARDAFGWEARFSLEQGLAHTWSWMETRG